MPDLEPFSLGESPSDYIVEIMYAVFILSALILLVNMMIAVLSSTYERVEVLKIKIYQPMQRATKITMVLSTQ